MTHGYYHYIQLPFRFGNGFLDIELIPILMRPLSSLSDASTSRRFPFCRRSADNTSFSPREIYEFFWRFHQRSLWLLLFSCRLGFFPIAYSLRQISDDARAGLQRRRAGSVSADGACLFTMLPLIYARVRFLCEMQNHLHSAPCCPHFPKISLMMTRKRLKVFLRPENTRHFRDD